MTPTTFPCPFCGRKMGVGPDLLGHKVRCPNPQCKQVVVAPAPAVVAAPVPPPPPPPPPPHPVAVAPAPAPGLPPDLPVFNLPSPEAQDSIFGEAVEEGDDVFGSDQGNLPVPEMPPPVAPPPPVVMFVPAPPVAVPAPPPPVAYPAPAPAADPFAGFTAAPAYTPPAAVPVAAPPPQPVPAVAYPPPPAAPANPWAGFDQAPTPAPPQAAYAAPPVAAYAAPAPYVQPAAEAEPLPAARADEPTEPRRERRPEREDRRARPERSRPAEKGAAGGTGKLFMIGFFVAAAYAFLMTILAVYGLFIREGGKVPEGHPLSLIPDTRGEFPPADRKKTGKLGVPLDGPLPPELRAGLGKTVAVGAVEVEPVSVAVRKLTIMTDPEKGKGPTTRTPPDKAVVLTLKVKNNSPDLAFHPLDPAFNRKEGANDSPPTALVVGKSTFAGGAVGWPFAKGVKRSYEAEQADDDKPLAPGETRTYVVTTDAKSGVARAVQGAKDDILWRVQVRRGLVEFRGREVPVTALIGVEFRAADVKTTED